jgi:hypothetical protein
MAGKSNKEHSSPEENKKDVTQNRMGERERWNM